MRKIQRIGHLACRGYKYTPVGDNDLSSVVPKGALYDFARLRWQTALAGAGVLPDGGTVFATVYGAGRTLALTGPCAAFQTLH